MLELSLLALLLNAAFFAGIAFFGAIGAAAFLTGRMPGRCSPDAGAFLAGIFLAGVFFIGDFLTTSGGLSAALRA
jgi:hypothetical protein